MKSRYTKVRTVARIKVAVLVIALNVLFFPTLVKFTLQGDNRFTIKVGQTVVGVTDDTDKIFDYYREAKKAIATESEDMVYTKFPDISYVGEEVVYGSIDSDETIIQNMKTELLNNKAKTLSHAYSVKVNDMMVTVDSASNARQLLKDAISRYDVAGDFDISLDKDTSRELNVLYATIDKKENIHNVDGDDEELLASVGFENNFVITKDDVEVEKEQSFDSFNYGIESIDFSENIEIVEAYVPVTEVMDLATAEDLLLNEQETKQVYKVKSGDTLSEISMTVGLPLDDIIALNEDLENENSVLHIDQEILITVPEPELSIIWTEQAKLEESYNLPIQYIYNDEWYTNKSVTHQQPSAGYHEAVLKITHENDTVSEKETIYEEVIMEPVAKVIEVGTQVPPTYLKPISGGRLTSTFGRRNRPTKGASSYHKGIDWGCPIGTTVVASCGGTVVSAGWQRGYGHCVLIRHPDGKQTRYGHLSKIYVSAGQKVSQGQRIAASGNSGVSTGPHLHFEILVGGSQVNPFEYLN